MLIGHIDKLGMPDRRKTERRGVDLDIEDILEARENTQWCVITPEMIYLRGAITREKTDEVIKHILLMNSEACNAEKINLFIDSGGGDMAAAYGLVSVMRSSTIPINTIAMGCCASAALVIAMAGKNRQIDKYCTVMSHIFSTANPTMLRPNELENWVLSLQLDRNAMVGHYVECTGLTAKEVLADLIDENKDIYLTAQMAVDFNMFDSLFTDYNSIHSSTREYGEEVDGEASSFLEELNKELVETKQELVQLRELVNKMHSTLYFNSGAVSYPCPNIAFTEKSLPDVNYSTFPNISYGNFKQAHDGKVDHLLVNKLSGIT